MIMAVSMVVSLVVVVFIRIIFVIIHCHTMHNIIQHWVKAAETLISSSAVVQEGIPKYL